MLTQSTLIDEYTTEENTPETAHRESTTLEENTTEETVNISETALNETLLSDEALTMHTLEAETLTEPADSSPYSIKIYITKTLDIIRPGDHATNPYGDISYEHIYVGASKTMRGNTVENRESNSDLLAYWTTGGHDDLVSRAWSNSRKCWTTQTITGLKAGTFNLAIKATTQNSIMAQIPVTVIEQISPNRLGFVASAQKLRVATPTTASDVDVFCGAAVTIKGQVGNYWYVTFGNYWGFLPKSSVYDYPYATYSGKEHEYYLYNRDLMLQVTEFNDGPASYPNDYKLGINDFVEKYQKKRILIPTNR